MEVIKKSDELRFNKEEIDILKEARRLINEIYENLCADGNIDVGMRIILKMLTNC